MAPEQTGRMNRSIDSRSDLYALGVTFYEMLTGSLPFNATDPMEWVHCHIARKPPPPGDQVAGLAPTLSRIVLKLLAKTAEERYQTAAGVEQDLRRCLADWQRDRQIEHFALDEQGTPDRLITPEKLYGRDREVATLVAAFDRIVSSSVPEMVLVTGYSGIGKSAVVSELHKVLVPPRGLFASGKFDQYKRDIPYATLVQAFQGLVRSLLSKSDDQLAHWRDQLLKALEPNARLITDLIPELKLIIGEPDPVPALEPQQAQRRFMLVFRRFIYVFARKEHPLALFLDDLQWLDAATLDLLEDLLTSAETHPLMLIGAYRDNEVDASHPLTGKLKAIRAAGVRIDEITLPPLAREHIEQLIGDALHSLPARIKPLAQLVEDKTAGNPFFVIQFLQALADEQLLPFDHDAREWRWDPARIHAKGYTDNVVDLMVVKLVRLPEETQRALQQLACLGNVAEIATMTTVLGVPEHEIHRVLWEALRQELVECPDGAYAFVHDRIHEAAYSLTPEALRAQAHLRIGRLLVARTLPEQLDEAIFEIVGQLNRGIGLITAKDERAHLAQLNLTAGQRAKASTAYASALIYLSTGMALLDDDDWLRRDDLLFSLALTRAECELLTGQLTVADERLSALATRASHTVERGRVACLHMDVCLLMDRSDHAVTVCIAYLRHVGIDWSSHPSDHEVRVEYEQIWTLLGDRTIEALIDLPLMEDAASLITLEALSKLFAPALQSDANLACLTICKAVNLSMERGNSDAACVLYANVGRVAGRHFGDYQAGLRFGQLGCDLVEHRGLTRFEASTYLCFSAFVARWMKPARECRELLRRSFVAANRIGDLAYGAYAGNSQASDSLFAGEPLPQVQEEAEAGLVYAQKVRFGLVIDFITTQLALIRMLRGLTPTFGCFDSEQFDEARTEVYLSSTPDLALAACWYWIRKLQAHFLAGDPQAALHAGAKARALLWTSYSFYEEAEYTFYDALARAADCDRVARDERAAHLDTMAAHLRQLQVWAQQCPENFAGHSALVAAEIARVEGRVLDAEGFYEQAVLAAQQSGFVQIEALANELASRFYAARGMARIARLYLQDARYGYRRWGADGKVRQLDSQHAFLISDEPAPGATTTMATPVEHLDLATVLKVSQAASGEIVLEKLIERVMRTAIEQAGAERGVLILADRGTHRVVAQATAEDDVTQLQLQDVPLDAGLLPESVLNRVLRSGETLFLDDATVEPLFAADPYVRQHRARSILCLPLMHQARMTGALYLENNLAPGVFSPARIAVLRLVAAQAASSLENARLYREVAEREAKIRRLVDANIIGIVVWKTDGEIIDANDAFLRLLGYRREDVDQRLLNWKSLTAEDAREVSEQALTEAVETGGAGPYEKAYLRKDGSRLPAIVGLAMFEPHRREGVAFVLDLTERKQAEQKIRESEGRYREAQIELAHANRVATMGQLAASIAHEVSQPIASTVNFASAAQRWLGMAPPNLDEAHQALERILQSGQRAASVLERIRGLIRKTAPHKEPMDINAAIREMIELTAGQITKSGAAIQVRLLDDLPLIVGDRVELQQVLLNLIMNALEAMAALGKPPRKLIIQTELDAAGALLVSVSDSGPGFDPVSSEKVFTPFYTTKATGLGMGLSICRSIIEAHGGRLWVGPNPAGGARVQFTLPVSSAEIAEPLQALKSL
jgi:PAS domain S-box-containing protein